MSLTSPEGRHWRRYGVFIVNLWSGLRAFHWSLNLTMLGEISFNGCVDYRVIQYQGIGLQ